MNRSSFSLPTIITWLIKNLKALAVAILVAAVIKIYGLQAFKIPTPSMVPTLMIGDRLMANKLAYVWSEPQRGDIVVFKSPIDPRKDFVKRLVGFGSETLMIKHGRLYINGLPTEHPRLKDIFYYNFGQYAEEGASYTVPEQSFFVLGDNSANSKDSRYWGCLPRHAINGSVAIIYYPFYRFCCPQ